MGINLRSGSGRPAVTEDALVLGDGIFIPLAVFPWQFHHRRPHTPEQSLAFALLCNAIHEWIRKPARRAWIRAWLEGRDNAPYKAELLCEALDLDRQWLLKLFESLKDPGRIFHRVTGRQVHVENGTEDWKRKRYTYRRLQTAALPSHKFDIQPGGKNS